MVIKRWKQLLEHLAIDEHAISDEQVLALESWCTKHVSEDIKFTGSQEDKYLALQEYLSHYFTTICACQSDNLTDKPTLLGGMNCIQYAASKGYDRYLTQVLEGTSDKKRLVNDATAVGITALHLSALKGHLKSTEVLLSHGADTAKKSRLKQTPLHFSLTVPSGASEEVKARKLAIYNQLQTVAPSLIQEEDISGTTVAHLAAQNGFTDTLNSLMRDYPALVLKKNSSQQSCLHIAILNRRFSTANLLTAIPHLLSLADGDGKKPVHYAARYADTALLNACLGPEIGVNEEDHYKRTPLHFAASAGNLDAVIFLVERGANASKQDVRGFTAFHYAVESRNKALVRWLKENTSVDINQPDARGRSAFMNLLADSTAMDTKTEELIEYLMDEGADLSMRDISGNSAQDYLDQLSARGININTDITRKMAGTSHASP